MTQPDIDQLTAALKSVFEKSNFSTRDVDILERKLNPYSASFPSEIIRCKINKLNEVTLFAKYGGNHPQNLHDKEVSVRQGGVPYEAKVYHHVLLPQKLSKLIYYGEHYDNGITWLFLEHLQNGVHANKTHPQVDALRSAARWIGRVHHLCESLVNQGSFPFLKVYDVEYYIKWTRRTAVFSKKLEHIYPWLRSVCKKSEELAHLLSAQPRTFIHGDYYTDNILFNNGTIYPIDWGWAAIAAGENDLAALTERWPKDIVEQCELEYKRSRWPMGSPANFETTLDIARLYLLFRWLGDGPEAVYNNDSRWRFDYLYTLARRLAILS